MAFNRELSQFANYLALDASANYIGITTAVDANVGIGSVTPKSKLDVRGDAIVSGVTTSTGGFVGNLTGTASNATQAEALTGTPNVTVNTVTAAHINNTGVITASGGFVGDIVGDVTAGTVTASTSLSASTINESSTNAGITFGHEVLGGNATFSGTSTLGTVDINGGAIDGTAIGESTPSTGAFTTINSSHINSTGVVTAVSFSGDGSGLTGVASTDNIQTTTPARFLNNVLITGIATVGVVTGGTSVSATNIYGTHNGSVIGNVTGNVTGNADTATALQNARTIGGVSFDGSANINLPGVNATGNQDTSGNAATATTLENSRTIGGVSFDGSADINLPGVNQAGNQNTSGTAAGLSGTPNITVNAVTSSHINSSGIITAVSFTGDGSGLTGVASTDNIQTATPARFLNDVLITGITTVGVVTGGTSLSATNIYGTHNGNVIGNVVGNVTGNVTGNADTATTLQTARNIGGVSFDGSSNINLPGVNISGNQDTSGNAATATTLETARTIGGVSFDGGADINLPGVNQAGNQDTSGNAATATTLETARTIGGVSFNGSANIDLPGVNTAGNQNTSGTAAGLSGTPDVTVNAVTSAHINNSGVTTSTGGFVGDLTGNADTATTLETARTIGGVSFDGSANINLPGVNQAGNQDTSGNAATATTLETSRTLALSGDATGSASFDGSANATIAATLANSGVSAGSYGGAAAIPILTVDAKGRVTSATTTAVGSGLTVTGDTGSEDIDLLTEGLAITGNGNNVITTASGNAVDITLNPNVAITDLSASGVVTATSFKTGATGSAIQVNTATITGPSSITIDPAAIGDATGTVHILGNLQVEGTQTVIDSTTVNIADKNIQVATGAANNAAADGAGFTIDSGEGDKTFQYQDTGSNFASSENMNLADGKVYKIDNTEVLSETTLGSGVVNSSLTSVGTLDSLNVAGALTAAHVNVSGIVTASNFVATQGTMNITGDVTGTATTATNAQGLIGTPSITVKDITGTGNINIAGIVTASSFVGDLTGNVTGNADSATLATNAQGLTGTPSITVNAVTSAHINNSGIITAASFSGSGSGLSAGTTPLTTLDIDGATDIGADLVDGDLIVVDDGAGGTNRKSAMSRVKEYVLGGGSGGNFSQIRVTGISTLGQATATGLVVSGVTTATGGIEGNLTGDVTGNADTATTLETARTIGGVSFDGSSNINLPGVNQAGNQNTSGNAATATTLETARTIGGVSFDGSSNINLPGVNQSGNQDTSGNAATATALQTGRNFSASGDATASNVSFDGTGNVDLALTLANTGVSAGTFGSGSQVSQITVDSKGRITSATNVAISTSLQVSGGSGSGSVNLLVDGLTFVDGTYVNTSVAGTTVTIGLDAASNNTADYLVARDSSGNFSAGTISAALTGNVTGNVVGNVTGNVVGDLTGDVTGNADTATALQTGRSFTVTGDATTDSAQSFDGTGNVALPITLANSGVSAGSYGGAAAVPIITVDSKGRITSATTTAVGSGLTVIGDSGSEDIDLLTESLTITGGTNLTSSAASNGVTLNLDNDISITTAAVSGVVTAGGGFVGDLTGNAATATLATNAQGLTGTPSVTVNAITSAQINNTGVVTASGGFVGDLTGNSSTATQLATARDFTLTGDVTTDSAQSFNGTGNVALPVTLANSGVSAATYGSASAIPVLTVDSKGRVTSATTTAVGSGLTVVGDSGSEDINLLSESLTISGGSNLNSNAASNGVTVNLNDDISIVTAAVSGVVTASGGFVGNLTGNVTGDASGNAGTATALQTARTIGGVSFDGTANINLPGVNQAGNQDTSGNAATATLATNAQGLTGTPNVTVNSVTSTHINNSGITTSTGGFVGQLTGNVVGNVTGDVTGNADTASTLETARTIGGVSFDGSADINLPGVNQAGNQNTSGNAATATALQTARNIGGVSFDGTSNIDLPGVNTAGNQNTSGNAASATTLQNARTIGGVSFDGSANIDLPGVNATGNQDTSGNAATATALATARNIGGVSFDGTGDINLPGVNATGNQDTSGNAATATALATSRTLAISGDATGSASFDGSANATIAATLANSGVSAGSYGGAAAIPVLTVDAKGRITSATTTAVGSGLTVTGDTGSEDIDLLTEGLAITGGTNLTSSAASNGVEVSLNPDVSLTNLNASGVVTATSFKTGTEGSSIHINSATITGPSSITLDPAGIGDNTGVVHILGDLQVEGTTTTIDSTTVNIVDKNIQIATGAANDAAADGGGITVDSGEGDKTFQFEATGDNFGSSENMNLASGKVYKINNTEVLSATTLGSAVVNSSLTSVGTLGSLNVSGALTGSHISASGIVTAASFSGSGSGLSAGTTPLTTLDIDGATDIGADLSDGDLIVVDDGAGGTNRKSAMSRVKEYVLGGGSGGNFEQLNVTGISTLGQATATGLVVSGVTTATGGIEGNLTGNVTGNADSATALQTARNIGGVSFDGTADINLPGVNQSGNQDTSGNAATATTLETARTIGGVSFNGSANIDLPGVNTAGNQDTSGNAATATALATARNIGGVSFDGTADINLPGVNATGNQDTSGNAATATTLETARTIGGVSFDGSANINLPGVNATGNQDTSGNAATATALATSRTLAISGDATGSATFDGSANATIAATLANSGVAAATYGSTTAVPVLTVDAKGRITSATTASVGTALTVTGDSGSEDINLLTESLAITGGTNLTSSAASNGVAISLDNDISITTAAVSGVVTAGGGFVGDVAGDLTGDVTSTGLISAAHINASGVTTSTGGFVGNVQGNINSTGLSTVTNLEVGGYVSIGDTHGQMNQVMASVGAGVTWRDIVDVLPQTRTTQTFTATAGQTTFSFNYNVNYLDVFVNGVKLSSTELTATNGTSVVISEALFAGDIVEFHSYNTAGTGSGTVSSANDLTDVTLSSASNNDILVYNGSAFVNQQSLNLSGNIAAADLTLSGNLTVNGTQTVLNTATLNVEDLNITLANGAADSSAADGAGITIDGADATFNYSHSGTKWVANKSIEATSFLGNVTGNVTGNADTATTLQNARTIGGVSFDGSANINLPGVNATGNQDTSGNAATATALATARSIGGVNFDGTAGINLPGVNQAGNQDTTGNAATATALETARTIGGVSFNGSSNINLPGVNATGNQDTTGTAALAEGLTGTPSVTVNTVTASHINSSGIVTATSFRGDGSQLTGINADSTSLLDSNGDTRVAATTSGATLTGTLTVTGDVAATNFNSTSDITLKDNVSIIDNALDMINNLQGISWNWKHDGKASLGVSAQNVETVAPELVSNGDHKAVNYNGLIGILIEAVKEQSNQISELRVELAKKANSRRKRS